MITTECRDDVPTDLVNKVCGNDSLGFPPIDGGKPSHNLSECHHDWALNIWELSLEVPGVRLIQGQRLIVQSLD